MRYLASVFFVGLSALAGWAGAGDLRVEFVTAEEKPLLLNLRLSGTLEAKDSVDLAFARAGG
ncbi:hypothetical protein [Paracoccus methylarcula]|nr:hypothetical protein [Paracoccus methylarcula]